MLITVNRCISCRRAAAELAALLWCVAMRLQGAAAADDTACWARVGAVLLGNMYCMTAPALDIS